MPSEQYLSDDYVASLLTKDAKESTIKYSAFGLQALPPKRLDMPTTNAPRPNTRFLRNIIRETDSHNASLKSNEFQDVRQGLKKLHNGNLPWKNSPERARSADHDSDAKNDRRRKRRRLDEQEGAFEDKNWGHRDCPPKKSRQARSSDAKVSQIARRPSESLSEDESLEPDVSCRQHRRHHHRTSHRHARSSRSRSWSPSRPAHRHQERHRRRDRSRSLIRRRHRNRSKHVSHRRKRHSVSSAPEPDEHFRKGRSVVADTTTVAKGEGNESDPLENIIGPAPPPPEPRVHTRGRGTFSSSAIDAHFSATYDPNTDVRPNSDSEDDWDQALEALRDRQRWQQQGADRLRKAGFGEDFVKKWEKGGERNEDDVKWKGKGEGREWDRGKVVDADGVVDTKPEWGRLKGT